MRLNSTKIALGGVFSSLCLVLMFMTGLVPFATYALPALAGAMLAAVVIENGKGTAFMVYAGVSVLSLFIVPDREAAMMFITFLGYYPIVKERLETLRSRIIEYVCKLLLFNITVAAGYIILAYVFGIPFFEDGEGVLLKYGPAVMLAAGNIVFIVYDHALTRYISLYVRWFRPRFLRK